MFEELLTSPLDHLIEKAVSDGYIPIGYTCPFVPEAFLMADKLVPLRLHAPGVTGTEIADIYMSNFTCSYTRSLLEFAIDDQFDMLQGWIFAPSCVHMQRLCDNLNYLKKPAFSHVLDVPRKVTEHTIAWQEMELRTLAGKLSSHFGVNMGDDSLNAAIAEWNQFAAAIQDIGELRKRPVPLISGTEFHRMVMAAQVSPKDRILPELLEFRSRIEQRDGIGTYRCRLLVTGSHLHDPEFIRLIESQGGLVVADLFCSGTIPGITPIKSNGDSIRALAEHTFAQTVCPRMMEGFDRRLKTILSSVKDYGVDGVVIEIMKFCDLWGVDSMHMVNALRNEGIPVLKLEREYCLSGEGQLRTRLQAFIESMGK